MRASARPHRCRRQAPLSAGGIGISGLALHPRSPSAPHPSPLEAPLLPALAASPCAAHELVVNRPPPPKTPPHPCHPARRCCTTSGRRQCSTAGSLPRRGNSGRLTGRSVGATQPGFPSKIFSVFSKEGAQGKRQGAGRWPNTRPFPPHRTGDCEGEASKTSAQRVLAPAPPHFPASWAARVRRSLQLTACLGPPPRPSPWPCAPLPCRRPLTCPTPTNTNRGAGLRARRVAHVIAAGPRIRTGIAIGQATAEVNAATARLSYRGKVMNRAARISSKVRWLYMQWHAMARCHLHQIASQARCVQAGCRGRQPASSGSTCNHIV